MSNVIDFVLQLRDMTRGPLDRFRQAGGGVARDIERSMRMTGQSVDELQRRVRDLTNHRNTLTIDADLSAANREIAALEQRIRHMQGGGSNGGGSGSSGGFLGTTAAMALGGLASNAIGAAGAAVKDQIAGIITAGADAEKDMVGLTTFLGDKGAKDVYGQIQQDAAATPYGTKSLLAVDRALISAGVSAKDAREDMLGLANAIAATGGGDDELGRMAQNMQQIKNVGKATATDIKQFGIAGINIYQLLADATGKTVAQTQEMEVSYELLSKALRQARAEGGLYAGAMERQSKTIYGKWSTIKDNVEIARAQAMERMRPTIDKFLDFLEKKVSGASAALARFVPYIDKLADKFFELYPYFEQFGGAIMDALKPVWDLAMSDGMSKLVEAVVDVSTSIVKDLTPAVKLLAGAIEWILDKIPAMPKKEDPMYIGGKAYVWDTSGVKPNAIDKKAMDSIVKNMPWTGNNPLQGAPRFFNSVEELKRYDQKAPVAYQYGDIYTKIKVPQIQQSPDVVPTKVGKAIEDASESVIKGGPRAININFRNLVEHQVVEGDNAQARADDWLEKMKEAFYRLLAGVPA